MFRFVVRYLGFLKHVPIMAVTWDALMMIWNAAFNKELIVAIDRIEDEVSAWQGIDRSLHKFGGLQFNYQSREIGHIHSNGVLDILFSKTIKQELIREGLVSEHHVFVKSGWVSFYVKSVADVEKAVGLLARAKSRAEPPRAEALA
jgi:Family of unknown function (DUF5519)